MWRGGWTLSLALLHVSTSVLATSTPQRLHVDGTGQFRDEAGRQVILHGANVVFKGFPWHPPTQGFNSNMTFSDIDMQIMESWGFNAVRLGVMWQGTMPEGPHTVNKTYLEVMGGIVDTMAQYGLYAVVDAHQDVYSAAFCGEGAPMWATYVGDSQGFPYPLAASFSANASMNGTATYIPTREECSQRAWFAGGGALATNVAYEALYTNTNGIRDAFVTHWTSVAATMKGKNNVLGYELWNEPGPGNVFADPLLGLPGVADKLKLQPFYDVLAPAIHAVDPEGLVMFESWTNDMDEGGIGKAGDVGFTHTPGAPSGVPSNATALSFHYYPGQTKQGVVAQVTDRVLDAHELGCGNFLTEFGISLQDAGVPEGRGNDGPTEGQGRLVAHAGTGSSVLESIVDATAAADASLVSWTGWEYKPFDPITGAGYTFWYGNGTLENEAVQVLSRMYPQAVAGTLHNFTFNASTSHFTMTYTPSEDVPSNMPTEVYVNTQYHGSSSGDVDVIVSPAGAATVKVASTVPSSTAMQHGASISATVEVTAQRFDGPITVQIQPAKSSPSQK